MKTNIILAIIGFVIGLLFYYGSVAFVCMELNPLKWNEKTRLPFAIFLPLILAISAALPIAIREHNKTNKI